MNVKRFLPLLMLPLFVITACDEEDGGDDGAMETDEGGDSGESAGDDSGPDDSGPDDSGDDSGPDDSGDDSGPDDSGDPSDDSGAGQCDGGWYLGSVPFVGETFIGACDGNPPSNCLTGNYIVFDDGECLCLPECGQAGLSEGDACTDDGSVTCTRIENDEGTSSGVFCAPPEWGLCG